MTTNATVVTCYYKFHSKHSVDCYDEWIHLFLEPFEGKMVINTSPDLVPYFQSIINKKSNPENILLVPREVDALPIYLKYKHIWDSQEELDRAINNEQVRARRNKGCFVLWNSKMEFLREAIAWNPFGSDKFVWNDIGNVRNSNIRDIFSVYPKSDYISDDKIDIVLIANAVENPNNQMKKLEMYRDQLYQEGKVPCFQNDIIFSGSVFGSSARTLQKMHTLFYEMFEYYLREGKFIGCDQQIMASIFVVHPELFNLVDPTVVKLHRGINPWFGLQSYYSIRHNN
jgi:hypothetical protein